MLVADTVTIVVPTIEGREEMCALTVAAFRATVAADLLQIVLVKDRQTIGEAWNDGAEASDGKYMMLAADDVLPRPGWLEVCIEAVEGGYYPSPHIVKDDGGTLATGSMGGGWLLTEAADWAPVVSSQFPFMLRDAWPDIGECLPIHYFADDYLASRARAAGWMVAYREGYGLMHLEGTIGREQLKARAMTDRLEFEESLAGTAWANLHSC